MTFEAQALAYVYDMDVFAQPAAAPALKLAANDRFAPEPEAGWATRNPDRAMALLFVNPRDGAMVEELLAA
jgi:hypothetical protein